MLFRARHPASDDAGWPRASASLRAPGLYKSLAAMQAAESIESPGVAGAKFIIRDQALALTRTHQLGCGPGTVDKVIAAFKQSSNGTVEHPSTCRSNTFSTITCRRSCDRALSSPTF